MTTRNTHPQPPSAPPPAADAVRSALRPVVPTPRAGNESDFQGFNDIWSPIALAQERKTLFNRLHALSDDTDIWRYEDVLQDMARHAELVHSELRRRQKKFSYGSDSRFAMENDYLINHADYIAAQMQYAESVFQERRVALIRGVESYEGTARENYIRTVLVPLWHHAERHIAQRYAVETPDTVASFKDRNASIIAFADILENICGAMQKDITPASTAPAKPAPAMRSWGYRPSAKVMAEGEELVTCHRKLNVLTARIESERQKKPAYMPESIFRLAKRDLFAEQQKLTDRISVILSNGEHDFRATIRQQIAEFSETDAALIPDYIARFLQVELKRAESSHQGTLQDAGHSKVTRVDFLREQISRASNRYALLSDPQYTFDKEYEVAADTEQAQRDLYTNNRWMDDVFLDDDDPEIPYRKFWQFWRPGLTEPKRDKPPLKERLGNLFTECASKACKILLSPKKAIAAIGIGAATIATVAGIATVVVNGDTIGAAPQAADKTKVSGRITDIIPQLSELRALQNQGNADDGAKNRYVAIAESWNKIKGDVLNSGTRSKIANPRASGIVTEMSAEQFAAIFGADAPELTTITPQAKTPANDTASPAVKMAPTFKSATDHTHDFSRSAVKIEKVTVSGVPVGIDTDTHKKVCEFMANNGHTTWLCQQPS